MLEIALNFREVEALVLRKEEGEPARLRALAQAIRNDKAPKEAEVKPKLLTINTFRGEYEFLSNFSPAEIEYEGILYPTTEHAFQAAKMLDPDARRACAALATPGQAKRWGRAVKLRPDWEHVKLDVMEAVLRLKFARPELTQKLLATSKATLIEGNTWGDKFWGVCDGVGENHLGLLLMKVRDALVREQIPALPADWAPRLEIETYKPYWLELWRFLLEQYNSSKVYPEKSQVFRALELCPPQRVKVVIIGQDPYHGPGQAQGLAFSVPPATPLPPSLRNILEELERDLDINSFPYGCLERWARQGVLLLNTALTVRDGEAASHAAKALDRAGVGAAWETFVKAVLKEIVESSQHTVFVLWGGHAIRMMEGVVASSTWDPTKKAIVQSTHPSPLSASKPAGAIPAFKGSAPFSTVNRMLEAWGRPPIDWRLEATVEWKRYRVSDRRALPQVIEAPSVGVAVEVYLACHGLLGYDHITVRITHAPADEDRAAVLRLIPEAEEVAAELDTHYREGVEIQAAGQEGLTRAQAIGLTKAWTKSKIIEVDQAMRRWGWAAAYLNDDVVITDTNFAFFRERPTQETLNAADLRQRGEEGCLEAWTDGSGTAADKPSGIGVVMEMNKQDWTGRKCPGCNGCGEGRPCLPRMRWHGDEHGACAKRLFEIAENSGNGTNNHAELSAIWRALTLAPDLLRPLTIYSDSQYAIGCASNEKWKPRVNLALIERIRKIVQRRGECVSFLHVKGHAGVPGNELADRLASQGRLQGGCHSPSSSSS